MSRRFALGFVVIAVAACGGGGSSTNTGPTTPAPVATVTVSAPSSSVIQGQTLQLAAALTDASGALLSGRTITWASSVPSVASVSTGGLLTGVSAGTTTISATSEGKTGSLAIAVTNVAVASVVLTPAAGVVSAGGTLQLNVAVFDATGAPISGQTVTWTSSDPTKATVTASGVVSGLGSATAPQVSSVSPAAITPGASLTITGSNFSTAAAGVTVAVAGTPVLVTSATSTQILATVPPTFPCLPSGSATLAVANAIGTVTITATAGGRSGTASVAVGSAPATTQTTLQLANPRTLAVGASMFIADPTQVGCNELTGTAGRYLISVYNVSSSPSSSSAFELHGAASALANVVAASVRAPSANFARAVQGMSVPNAVRPSSPAKAFARGAALHAKDGHAKRLARASAAARPALQRMKAGGVRPARDVWASPGGASQGAPSQGAAVIPLTVGSTTTIKVDTAGFCSTWINVTARVVYVGTKSVVLEAVNAPLAGKMDTDYINLGKTFDNVMFPILTQYFGNPFAFDDSLQKLGKITMLFTPLVNAVSGSELGFTTPCDQFPAQYDSAFVPSSNNTPMFYARVPTNTTANINDIDSRVGWNSIIPGTLIHESKHVTAVAERFADPVGDNATDESWFEEGTAQLAPEFYARTVYAPGALTWKGNATYANTVRADYTSATAQYILGDHFLFLYDYLSANESASFMSDGSVDADIYGSAWLFARWLLDQYSTQESDLLKPLIQDATMVGIENITNKSGRPWEELDGYYTLALAADDYPGSAPPVASKYVIPSWNLRSIYSGLAGDFAGQVVAWPLNFHAVSFGAFTTRIGTLLGGSGAIFDLSGTQTGRQLLDLHALSGAPLPSGHTLRISIVRIQ